MNKFHGNSKQKHLLNRMHSISFEEHSIYEYLDKIKNISIRDLEYIPYFRFLIAIEFEKIFGIKNDLLNILKNPDTGSVLLNCNHYTLKEEPYIKISTAISYLLGIPNIDPLSGTHFATFTVKHTDVQVPNLLRPYEAFKMHTDGAYMEKVPDWIFFMKMQEINVAGGLSKLLHIDDWNDFDYFYNHSINKEMVKFFSHPEPTKNTERSQYSQKNNSISSSLLNIKGQYKSVRFVDRFIDPKNLEEAEFIYEFQNSLENSTKILEIDIPVGWILIVNNHRWLHGRKPFEINPGLTRKLMRQRGNWV